MIWRDKETITPFCKPLLRLIVLSLSESFLPFPSSPLFPKRPTCTCILRSICTDKCVGENAMKKLLHTHNTGSPLALKRLPLELSQLIFTGIGRLEKIIFFLTTATTDQAGLRCSSFSSKSRPPSITSSSESTSTELRTELRWSIARGFGSETIFPSRRWWPMRRVGLF